MTARRKPAPRSVGLAIDDDGFIIAHARSLEDVTALARLRELGERPVEYVRRDILDRALRALDTAAQWGETRKAREEHDYIRKLIAEETKT